MKTKLHYYYFDLNKPEEEAAWQELKAKLEAMPGLKERQMHSWGGTEASCKNETEEVEIETACLFDNQWNTTTARVFDWFLQCEINGRKCRRGHWLEITPEMEAARRDTFKCGYCGKHYGPLHDPAPADGFCSACLDSPYLKETELYLTRLESLAVRPRVFAPLSVSERETLVPRYINRQTTGSDSRAAQRRAKQREKILSEYESTTKAATTERDGFLWLWEKGLDLENVIYYDHTDKFSFGWRSPVAAGVKAKLLDILAEFPFEYEIKSGKEVA